MKRLILGTIVALLAYPTGAQAPPSLTMDIWQGPQRSGNYGLDYLSSVLLQNISVEGQPVPDGTQVQLWTPSRNLTGITSVIVGSCQTVNSQCVMGIDYPISQDIAKSGDFPSTFYLPAYKVAMGYGWHWRPCE